MAGEEAVNAVANTAKGVARLGIRGVNRVGSSTVKHTDAAFKNVFSRRRGGRRSRRNRRNSRKNRRSSRRNRRN